MLVHSMLPRSAVNGPGERVVVWFQGCDLRCPGCWNPSSHPFDRTRDMPVEQLGEWVLSCRGVEGVTLGWPAERPRAGTQEEWVPCPTVSIGTGFGCSSL